MSAYVVERNHIAYLLAAATSMSITEGLFRWHTPGGEWQELAAGDINKAVRVGQMLWEENIRSVLHRYPNDSRMTMPGPIGESYKFTARDILIFLRITPVQVLKSCHCLAYQSCEHPQWEASEAKAFIDALESRACRKVAGYDEAEWGAPRSNIVAKRMVQS